MILTFSIFWNCDRCDFGPRPAKNHTVADLVETFPFEWPCKYQNAADCGFEGTRSDLELHEADCKSQLANCIITNCEMVPFGTIVEHFGSRHKRIGKVNYPSSMQGMTRCRIANVHLYYYD
jgi:hypothetical protein